MKTEPESVVTPVTTVEVTQVTDANTLLANATKDIVKPNNPLLADWVGPFETVPQWDKYSVDQFPVAFQYMMDVAKAEVGAIADNPQDPTFNNTIEAMQMTGRVADRVNSVWGVYTSNLSNKHVQAVEAEWDPKMSAFYTELYLNPKLFQRVKTLYDNRANLNLAPDQMRLLERNYRSFVRNGALLDQAQKERVIAIEGELAGLYSTFGRHLLADEGASILITDKQELAGIPAGLVAQLAAAAKEDGKTGYAIANTRSVVQPVLESASNRKLRERVYKAFVSRGDNGDADDNKATIAQILKLRQERAVILGFKNHAWYRMDDTMAKTPEAAMGLMMKVWPAAVARVHQEVDEMQALANKEKAGIKIEPWDYRYYMEKVRKDKYALDQGEVKQYFQLDKMVEAMFWSAGQLYGYTFSENTGSVPVFQKDVRTFEVKNRAGKTIGLFYLDTYARAGKRSGAWMTTYRTRSGLMNDNIVLASNNNNFAKPVGNEPTLISQDDASTLFHEFGHALHYLTIDVRYPEFNGSQRDFVEYPSQVNENWLMTPEVLNRFARHYKTGAPMPKALIDKIEAASTFMQGHATVEYLSSAILDMKLHNRETPVTDISAFERETLAELGMPKEMVMRHRLPQFGHLFSSDAYSAGYYSYLWSETMDADTWAAFEEAGNVWDPTIAGKFQNIILKTGSETDRIEAYRAFRGRDPDVNALLKRRGFPTQ